MDIIFEKCNMKAFKILKYSIYKICACVLFSLWKPRMGDKASFLN